MFTVIPLYYNLVLKIIGNQKQEPNILFVESSRPMWLYAAMSKTEWNFFTLGTRTTMGASHGGTI